MTHYIVAGFTLKDTAHFSCIFDTWTLEENLTTVSTVTVCVCVCSQDHRVEQQQSSSDL